MTAQYHKANYILNFYFIIWLGQRFATKYSSQFTDIPSQASLTEKFNYVIL